MSEFDKSLWGSFYLIDYGYSIISPYIFVSISLLQIFEISTCVFASMNLIPTNIDIIEMSNSQPRFGSSTPRLSLPREAPDAQDVGESKLFRYKLNPVSTVPD